MQTLVAKLSTLAVLAALAAAVVCPVMVCPAIVCAQPPTVDQPKVPADKPATPPADPAPEGGVVREAKPETFYLIDKDGKLVPFFDIPFEEFRRLYLLDRKLKAPDLPPRFSLQQMSATGTADANSATLDINFRVQLNESGWTRVPLRMNNAVLVRDEGNKDDPGKQFIEYDRKADGYVGWLQGEKGTSQVVKLKLIVPLERVAGDSRLLLQTPRASGAELRLKVSGTGVVVDPIEGLIVQPVRKLPDGRTELHLLGLAGDVPLTWREAREQPAKVSPLLEVSGATLFRFAGQSHVSSESRLKVRGLNGPIDSFQVRLPVGLKLIPVSQSRYVVSAVESKTAPKKPPAGAPPEAQLVDVKLPAKTSEPVEVTLLAEMTRDAASAATPWETSGFEVLGAIGQWGHIDLAVEGDWSLQWVEGAYVQRVPEPAEATTRQAITARFEYSRQPYSLRAQVLPRRTRISVEPSYVVQLESQQARLEARLKYRIRGAKAYTVEVDLTGWKLDAGGISPANLVQAEALVLDEVSPLKIPLSALAQSAGGDFELRITAYRETRPGEPLIFNLPRPQASSLTPAVVVLLPADNVELTPSPTDLQGLVTEPLPPLIKLPPRQQSPLSYRDRSENGPAVFAGQYKVRKGIVTIAGTGRVKVEERVAQVEQRLSHRISFEPLKELSVEVPRALFRADAIKFTLDGEPVAAVPVEDEPGEDETAERQRVRLDLHGERIGPCEIVASFAVPLPPLESGKHAGLQIPLVVPVETNESTLTTNSLTLSHADSIHLERNDEAWAAYEDSETSALDEQQLFAPLDTPGVSFGVALVQSQKRGATSVRQTWLQTWLTAGDRRDRAVFRLTSTEGRVRIQLPPGARTDEMEVAIDGHSVPGPRASATGQIELELPDSETPREFVVELWYSFTEGRPARGSLLIEPPHVVGAPWTSRMYWQLVVPRSEHLIFAPSKMSPELVWRWQGLGWGRQAGLAQADLEKWIGATTQTPLPSSVNQYLYSSFGSVERIEVHTASRALLLFIVSGVALAAGLLLLYVPALRHPAVLLVLAVAVLAGGLFDLEPALQVAQVAVLGVALVLVSRVLRWLLSRRRSQRAVIHGTSLFGLDSGVGDSRPARREVDSRVSTATAPLTIPVPTAELQP